MNGQRDRCAVVRACWAGVHEATRVRLGNDRPLVASSVLGQPFSYHTTFVAIYIGYLLVIAVVPPGEGGKLPPVWVDVQKLCHGTSSYHTTNTLQGRRAKSHVDTQTIQPGLGDFVL